jgi:hypothetical protein
MIINCDTEKMWGEEPAVHFKALLQHLREESEETMKTSVKVDGLRVKNRTSDHQKTKLECQPTNS